MKREKKERKKKKMRKKKIVDHFDSFFSQLQLPDPRMRFYLQVIIDKMFTTTSGDVFSKEGEWYGTSFFFFIFWRATGRFGIG